MVRDVKESSEIANQLRPVLLRLARELRREVHSLGVTGSQVSLLVVVKHAPGITSAELAERERVSAPAMSNHVARLESLGLISRVREGEDRRRVGLALTAQGEKVLRSVRTRRTAWLARRIQRLSDDECAAVEAAVGPLEKLLGDGE